MATSSITVVLNALLLQGPAPLRSRQSSQLLEGAPQ